jgi:hypothetical protein
MDKTEGFAPPLFTFHSSLFTSNWGLSQSDKPQFKKPPLPIEFGRGEIFDSRVYLIERLFSF